MPNQRPLYTRQSTDTIRMNLGCFFVDNIVPIEVSYDGRYAKRGIKSLYAMGYLVEVYTGCYWLLVSVGCAPVYDMAWRFALMGIILGRQGEGGPDRETSSGPTSRSGVCVWGPGG